MEYKSGTLMAWSMLAGGLLSLVLVWGFPGFFAATLSLSVSAIQVDFLARTLVGKLLMTAVALVFVVVGVVDLRKKD